MSETHKRYSLIALIIVAILPLFAIIPLPTINSLEAWALYSSTITGYIGVVLLLAMYIIGTRATSRYLFRDTAPVLKIHSWLGKYGSIATLLHPLLIILGYSESLLYSIVPQLGTEFERHVTLGRISFLIVCIIWVSSALLRSRMSYRPWKYIHYLAYISLPFALLHVPDVGSVFMSSAVVRAYYFLLVIVALIFTCVRIYSLFNLDRTRYRVIKHIKLMDDTFALVLHSDEPLPHIGRGQYVYVKLGFVSEDHPFTVLQHDESSGELTLAYRVFGTFTDSLSRLIKDQTVYIDGPYGSFTEQAEQSDLPIVFIAGGIGITPFVDHILRGANHERWLFYAAPSSKRAIFLEQLRDELGNRCVALFSQTTEVGAEHGYINSEVIQRHLKSPSKYQYYICGPEGMMHSSVDALKELGVPKSQIHQEAFAF